MARKKKKNTKIFSQILWVGSSKDITKMVHEDEKVRVDISLRKNVASRICIPPT